MEGGGGTGGRRALRGRGGVHVHLCVYLTWCVSYHGGDSNPLCNLLHEQSGSVQRDDYLSLTCILLSIHLNHMGTVIKE